MSSSIEMPLVHIVFVIFFLLGIGFSLVVFLAAIMQKSLKWKSRSLFVLILVGVFAVAIFATGLRSAWDVDFAHPQSGRFMYMHIGSGLVTVGFACYVAVVAARTRRKTADGKNQDAFSKQILIYMVVLLAFSFLTLNLGKNVLETGAAVRKQEALYGPN